MFAQTNNPAPSHLSSFSHYLPVSTLTLTRKAAGLRPSVTLTGWITILAAFGCRGRPPEPPADPACPTCEIQLQHVVTLGTAGGPGGFSDVPAGIAQLSDNSFVVTTPDMGNEEPFLFDSTGAFVARLGRVGDGPGEFRNPSAVVAGPGNTLHFFERYPAAKVTVFHNGKFVRNVQPVPGTYDGAVMTDGSYLVNNTYAAFPLQIWSDSGQMLAEFGTGEPFQSTDATFRNQRAISVAKNGVIWTVTKNFDYIIKSWDSDGHLISEHRPNRPWFKPYDSSVFPTPDEQPNPSTNAIWLEGEDMLWTFGRVAATSWADGLARANWFGQEIYRMESPQLVFDLQIDVFDLVNDKVLSSRRIPGIGAWATIVAPGLLATRRTDDDGWWYADIWKLDLVMQDDSI